jgi:hypothetical protein
VIYCQRRSFASPPFFVELDAERESVRFWDATNDALKFTLPIDSLLIKKKNKNVIWYF